MIDLEKHRTLDALATSAPWQGGFSGEPLCIGKVHDAAGSIAVADFRPWGDADMALVIAMRNDHMAMVELLDHFRTVNVELMTTQNHLRGAVAAQDERNLAATTRLGLPPFDCDTPDHLADEIEGLRKQRDELQAVTRLLEEHKKNMAREWSPIGAEDQ